MATTNRAKLNSKKIFLIALIIFIPIIGAFVGGSVGTWNGINTIRSSTGWHSLGMPLSTPNQLLGLCEKEICVGTQDGKRYRYDSTICRQRADQTCWVIVASAEIELVAPQLYNPCMYEFQMPSPPADTIQILGAKTCGSGGDIYNYYALLEDGSVWKLEHYVADLAPLAVLGGGFVGIIIGLVTGILAAIFTYAFGWPRVNRKNESTYIQAPIMRPNTACTRTPATCAGAMVVGVAAFLGSLRGLRLIPAKWRCLVPPTSG